VHQHCGRIDGFVITPTGNVVTLASTNPAIMVPPSPVIFGAGGTVNVTILRTSSQVSGTVTATVNGNPFSINWRSHGE